MGRLLSGIRDLEITQRGLASAWSPFGSVNFPAVERGSAEHGCVQLTIETQNTNAPACRFYHRHGCRLVHANRGEYPALPEEIQLLWYKKLT